MSKEKKTYTRYLKDPVLDPYFIQLDDYGYVLHKSITAGESGKEYSQVIGYYNNLANVLKALAKNDSMSKNHDSIQSYIDNYESIINKLNQAYSI
jgi:ppGpp synthetase/RelA/SpoT-type nucleotidyltranferase